MAQRIAIILGAFSMLIGGAPNSSALEIKNQSHFRRPVELALVKDRLLLVANQRSGSVSIVDTKERRVDREVKIGKRLAGLALSSDGRTLAVVDESASELVLLAVQNDSLHELSRLAVSTTPVSVSFAADDSRVFVGSLWSRRLTIVDVTHRNKPTIAHVLDLPFAPRNQLGLPDGETLLVADSFGGRLALVNTKNIQLRGLRTIVGHNIRGLGLSSNGESLFIPHQVLHSEKLTTEGGVHWGGVLSNVVRNVSISELTSKKTGPLTEVGTLFYLGHPDDATGDPTVMLSLKDGRQIVSYAGISQVAISDRGVNYYKRVNVGRRPSALVLSKNEKRLFVANTFSDSISIIDVDSAKLVADIPLGPQPRATLVDDGEMLFYDARLSSDGWYSCNSCHPNGHTNGGLNDNFGDDSYGAPKRVLSLLGVSKTGPWAWNGSVDRLEKQVKKSIETTMQGPPPTDHQIKALTAYLRTLQPPPALARARNELDLESVNRGRALFERKNCADCHERPNYTNVGVFDVGVRDELGQRDFNPPSLLGVSQLDRLFHDNRSGSLRETFAKLKHGLDKQLSVEQLNDLVAYLSSL
ncbi:MAG: hypothetical protein IH991_17745 [Planctomycetes bacterium]|nr:hypothetical protein [Planctomycetota bacterium]